MVWQGKDVLLPENPPKGEPVENSNKVELKTLPASIFYGDEDVIPNFNLIITDKRTDYVGAFRNSNNTVTIVYHWQNVDYRDLRGLAWSSVTFVETAGIELRRSNPDIIQIIERGCLTNNVKIMEV